MLRLFLSYAFVCFFVGILPLQMRTVRSYEYTCVNMFSKLQGDSHAHLSNPLLAFCFA